MGEFTLWVALSEVGLVWVERVTVRRAAKFASADGETLTAGEDGVWVRYYG